MRRSHLLGIPTAFFLFIVLIGMLLLFPILLSEAFRLLGFSVGQTILLFLFTLLGSVVNIPIKKIRTKEKVQTSNVNSFFDLFYPKIEEERRIRETTIAVNLGGAVIPIFISFLLLANNPGLWSQYLIGIGIVSVISYFLSRPVPGVGITLPMFIPPLAAAFVAVLLPGDSTAIAYVGGVIGVLLGADIFNLTNIKKYQSRFLSIGGAGTFDGIFLTGIIAVLLASL